MQIKTLTEENEQSRIFIYYLILTAVICGALVMVVEVMGSRVIGPFFGVSLFVWTSLITVALVALAAGYAAGGILSDRKSSPDYLYAIILAAGISVFLIPLMKGVVLKSCLPLGLRSGALVSSMVLFGPSLFLLGCVSPYIVKIAVREMKNIGRTVGVFYAISTVGSCLGTVSTGFLLIAYFSVSRIFEAAGLVLVFLSAGYFLLFRRKWQPLLCLIIPLFLIQPEALKSKIMPDGTRVAEVFSRDGFYGKVKVVDYSYRTIHTRELVIDGLVQGGVDMNNRLPIYEYLYFMEFLPYSLNPAGKDCLVIGLGAGIIPMWYEKMGIKTDVVDIDPDVVAAAKRYFGFRTSGDVILSDARYYLNTPGKAYDFIILDVFNGDTTPGHILSIEALRVVKKRMAPEGILAINLIGSLKEETFMTASLIKTVEQVFNTVDIYPAFDPEKDGIGNVAVIAHNHSPVPFNKEAVKAFPVHPMVRSTLDRYMGTRFHFSRDTPAVVLSDDYNPIDFYDTWLKEKVRKAILETTDPDILI